MCVSVCRRALTNDGGRSGGRCWSYCLGEYSTYGRSKVSLFDGWRAGGQERADQGSSVSLCHLSLALTVSLHFLFGRI